MSTFHQIRLATEEDIPFILNQEADTDNAYVHAYDEATHTRNILDPAFHYFIAMDANGQSLGYAILIDGGNKRMEWRRIIVANKGGGIGKAFMAAVLDYFFSEQQAESVWLDVYEKNARARHVYRSLGFQETGEDLTTIPGERLVIMECPRPR